MADKYPINVQGKQVAMSVDRIGQLIRSKMRKSRAIMALFESFEVAPEQLDKLQFVITPMEDKHAETDGKTMNLNTSLFENGEFFEKFFFVPAHEVVHWLSRLKEEDSYFNDPEEVLGFVSSVAYELETHGDMDICWNRVYPRIEWHFHNESDSREFFKRMVVKAKELLR